MSCPETALQASEKAERDAALASGGIVDDAVTGDLSEKESTISQREKQRSEELSSYKQFEASINEKVDASLSKHDEDEERPSDQPPDLEALANTPSIDPPHSIFSKREKRFIVFMVACAGFFSPLSANIYFPALNTLAQEYHTTSSVMNLTLTSYMIFQGLAPTIFGDLADMAGRRPAYIIGFVIYIGACAGIASQHTYAALFILRCMQSSGSSGTIALGSGVAADIATAAERGAYMGWVTTGPMIAPSLGPVVGGLLAQYLGWRAIFWFLTICAGVFLIPFCIAFPETGRNVVGNGSIPPQGWNMSLLNYLETRKTKGNESNLSRTQSRQSNRQAQQTLAQQRRLRLPNPLNTLKLVREKDVGMLLLYNSLVYTAFYDVITSIPYLFQQTYGFDDLKIGICFIPFGVGCFCAPIINGRLVDWNFRRIAKQMGVTMDRKRGNNLKDFPIEKARLQVAYPLLYVGIAALLCYGWVMQISAPLAAPLVLQFIMGLNLTGAYQCMSVLLVDLYPLSPSTATASNNLVRCLIGAAGTAVIIQMIDSMGRGWCFTFLAAVIFITSPMMWALTKWGPRWREERRIRMEKEKEEYSG
ncbi:MAG: hypothetical protein M1821_007914 [Bathelium mastoideum]|nr:MAG: hypothetical protein M1821_007914 [Bathelium mastoideum]